MVRPSPSIHHVKTDRLNVAFEAHGPADGPVAILLHGFPYDPRCYDAVVPRLLSHGYRVVVPYLRGYGATRFLSPETPRSGEQAALGDDLRQFMDGLSIQRAVLAGYDWGGRAACIVAALWPERAIGLVSGNGYNIQNIAAAVAPVSAVAEHRLWYQYYFNTERGRSGLDANRRDISKLLWRQWSPDWAFDDATFDASAASFDNPDFVDVVIHSYRHRFGYVPGDPAVADVEQQLAAMPDIRVPSMCLQGQSDGVTPADSSAQHARHFTGTYERLVLPRVGHNVPQEAPEAFADAILKVSGSAR
jgi:pimeloyl-ACP methyl ester carboxylesterase